MGFFNLSELKKLKEIKGISWRSY